MPLALGMGNALWRSLIDFNCDGLAVYLVDGALMAEWMRIYPAAKNESRGATGSLAPRTVRGVLVNCALQCLCNGGSWLARRNSEGESPPSYKCVHDGLVATWSMPGAGSSSHSRLRQWANWDCAPGRPPPVTIGHGQFGLPAAGCSFVLQRA